MLKKLLKLHEYLIFEYMPQYTKENLKFTYQWKGDGSEYEGIDGFPSDKVLDRHNGFEVLHFINKYMEYKGFRLITTFHKIEDLLRVHLLVSTRSYQQIMEWLDANHIF